MRIDRNMKVEADEEKREIAFEMEKTTKGAGVRRIGEPSAAVYASWDCETAVNATVVIRAATRSGA